MSDTASLPDADKRSLFARLADALDDRLERALARLQRRANGEEDSAPEEAETTPEGAGAGSRLKLVLMIAGAALLALAAGGGSAYLALSEKIQRQAARLEQQSAELEAKTRALSDAEKRYLEQQLKLVKTEKRLSMTREQLEKQPAPKPEAAADRDKDARLTPLPRITVSPPPKNPAAVGGVAPGGKCAVSQGNIGDTLRACIQAFNEAQ